MSQPENELLDEPSEYEIDRFGNKIYKDENGDHHNPFGPALITRSGNTYWYKHGQLHREDGPAIESNNGEKKYWIEGVQLTEEEFEEEQLGPILEQPQIDEFGTEIWRNKDGKLHRDNNLPAMIFKDRNKLFYKNGELHRLNGPAIEYIDGTKKYWIEGVQLTEDEFKDSMDWEQFKEPIEYDLHGNLIPKMEEPEEEVLYETDDSGNITYRNEMGQLHREDGSASISINGSKAYYLKGKPLVENEYYKIPRIDEQGNKRWFNKDGKLHRDNDLPAAEMENGYKAWYIDGERHRNNGPAVVYQNGSVKWYMNGKNLEHSETLAREALDLPYDPN